MVAKLSIELKRDYPTFMKDMPILTTSIFYLQARELVSGPVFAAIAKCQGAGPRFMSCLQKGWGGSKDVNFAGRRKTQKENGEKKWQKKKRKKPVGQLPWHLKFPR